MEYPPPQSSKSGSPPFRNGPPKLYLIVNKWFTVAGLWHWSGIPLALAEPDICLRQRCAAGSIEVRWILKRRWQAKPRILETATFPILLRGRQMTAKKLIVGILGLLVIFAVMAPSLMAQSLTTGDINGTVTDPSGAVVPNAAVTLRNTGNGETRNGTTNSAGVYRFSLLSPGTYTVTVTAPGFNKTESSYNVNLGQATVANVKMALGSATQTVEVTTAAPLVQTDNADLSTSYGKNVIQNSPNGGNDLTYVAQTAPGVAMNTGQGYGNFNANGLPATSNLFTVNGENDMDPYLNLNNSGATNLTLGKNELQEATVITNAYSGQYGQQAGAQVNHVTRGGTNQYHGDVFYEWTGRELDANDWFNNHTTPQTPRPFANNNEWGANFGGPIKKDKIFFFVDYEAIQYIVPSTQPVYAPTPAFMQATLANLAATNPAEVPIYSKMFGFYSAAKGYPGSNPANIA